MLQILLILVFSSSAHSGMEPFIVGGRDASIRSWPFITFIEAAMNDAMVSACGGSLLSSQTVLTAAHCLDDLTHSKLMMDDFRFTIYMGHSTYNKASMVRRVKDYETHRNYDPANEDVRADIGIMFLHTPVHFMANVQKVILVKRKFSIRRNRNLMVAGWGRTEPNNKSPISPHLKDVKLKAISSKDCRRGLPFIDVTSVVCAETSHEYAYSGDSGGPMVERGSRYQLGIVSFRHEETGITVFTAVPVYYRWINSTQLYLYRKHCGNNG